MRTLFLLLLLAISYQLSAQPSRAVEASRAAAATAWLTPRLYIREATGNNDGPDVWALIKAGGGQPRMPWCGFTQRACQVALKLPYPAGAGGSYNWFLDKRRAVPLDSIRPGLLVGNYSRARGRIAHITRVVQVIPPLRKGRPPRGAYCIGGNEGSGTRAGMHRTLYPMASIYALSNWLF